MKHLESRPSKLEHKHEDKLDYFVEFQSPSTQVTTELVAELKKIASNVVLSPSEDRPWFPRHISELHRCCTTLFKYGHELTPDHPGYGDPVYEQRRKDIAQFAKNYK